MKKILTAVVIALRVIVSYAAGWQHTARLATTSLGARRVFYWVDPMHPSYKSDHPGIAPDCGMALEPVYAENSSNAQSVAGTAHLPLGGVVINRTTQGLRGIQLATVRVAELFESFTCWACGPGRHQSVQGQLRDRRVYPAFNDSVGVQIKKDQKLTTYSGP